ncbi:cadherin-like domain-containing protein, partial [Pseudomonas sp. NCHU5216]
LVMNADGRFTYTPDPDWNGTDGFTYRVTDGELVSAPASITLNVTPVNDAPLAGDARFTLEEDSTLAIDLLTLASDIEGDALTVEILSGPQHGQLVMNADGRFTYSPDPDWNGTDGFTYRVTDGELVSAPASITLNVTPVNDAPLVADARFTLEEDSTLAIDLLALASDIEGDALTVEILSGPQHGRLVMNADG